MIQPQGETYLNEQQVTERLNVSEKVLRSWIKRGMFPSAQIHDGQRTKLWDLRIIIEWEDRNLKAWQDKQRRENSLYHQQMHNRRTVAT